MRVCALWEGSMRSGVRAAMMACVAGGLLGGCDLVPTNTPAAANSFTEVYSTVLGPSCASVYCHYNGITTRYSALDMSSQTFAYWNLVDQPAVGPSCSQMGTRVVPFDPDSSILYLKISQVTPSCGSRMPADPVTLLNSGASTFSGNPLPDDQQQLVHDWIAAGAQDN
jgi:hypothetical protein